MAQQLNGFLDRLGRRGRTGFGRAFARELDWSGLLTLLAFVGIVALIATVFTMIRPPTVEEVERDIWTDWAHLATDSQGHTIIDLLLDGRQSVGQTMLSTLGRLIVNAGQRLVVRTEVRSIRIRDRQEDMFAEWISPAAESSEPGWKSLAIDLFDPTEGTVGRLEVDYRFYGAGLESLPNIRRLQQLYRSAMWLAGIFVTIMLFALLANVSRLRERAARLKSQQITLDLGHQMCHELRNGLWAFSLEGKNLRQLFERVDDFFRVQPNALNKAAERARLEEPQRRRLEREYQQAMAEENVDPATDVVPFNDMAKDSYRQIESFSRYINLTVEELDRNLLGKFGEWNPQLVRLGAAWKEACDLLAMRLKSAGVEVSEMIPTDKDVVIADRRALVHVFVNLAKNAIEALREQPGRRQICLEVEADAESVTCAVRNDGPPIPPAILPRVFEPGFSTKQGAGRGSGLAIAADSLRLMNATISVSSSAEHGTCFRIVFPRATPGAAEPSRP